MEERAQLNKIGIQDDPIWLHDIGDNKEMTRNCTALRLLRESSDVATKNDVPESKEQNVPQLPSSNQKALTVCTENMENMKKGFSRCD